MASSTFSTTGSHIDRKSLKRPDGFTATVSNFFTGLSKQSGILVLILAGVLAIGVGIGLFMNHLETKSDAGRNALFLAEKSLETEYKAMDARETKAPALKPTAQSRPQTPSNMDALLYKKLDVDSQFSETVKKLKDIDSRFGNTRSGFEARLKLADLYYSHADYEKALPWYEKALASAPNKLEKAISLSSMGYAQESLGKAVDALQSFQKALNLGEGSLKGDLLLGIARSHESLHDIANARSTYDKILSELPNTEYSKSAEAYKAQLQ